MRYPNAATGVKRIYLAEILMLIAAMPVLVVGIVMQIGTEAAEAAATSLPVATTVLGIAALILVLIGFILNLTGVIKARKDDEGFRFAMVFTLAGIVLTVAKVIFQENESVMRYLNSVYELCELFASYFVLTGIFNLASGMGDAQTANACATARNWLIGTYIASAVLALFVVQTVRASTTVAIVLGLVSSVIQIVNYVIYLRALGKGRAALNQ